MKTEHTPANFTPGPWEIHNNIGRKGELGILADGAPCIIAVMGNQKAWPLEAKANARLIAAAPDLLAALQAAIDGLTCYIPKAAKGYKEGCFKYVAGGSDMWNCDCPICKARAAIAKAIGQPIEAEKETLCPSSP